MLLTITTVNIQGKEETYTIEDVSDYTFDENNIIIHCNNGNNRAVRIRSNDGVGLEDWSIVEIKASRVGLTTKIEESNG